MEGSWVSTWKDGSHKERWVSCGEMSHIKRWISHGERSHITKWNSHGEVSHGEKSHIKRWISHGETGLTWRDGPHKAGRSHMKQTVQ